MKNRYLQLISNTGIFAIGNFLVKLIQFFLLPIYTSVMSAEAYGTAELLNNLSEMAFPVVTLAIYESVFRFTVDKGEDKDAILYESCLLVGKGFAALLFCLVILQHFMRYPYTYYVFFVLFSYSARMLLANFAKGSGYTKCFSLSGVVDAMVLFLFSWICLVNLHWGIKGYLLAVGCAHTVSAFVLLSGARITGRLMKRKCDKGLLKRMLAYSLPLIINNISYWVTSMAGRYIVLFVYGAGAAGLYTAANKLPAVISMLSQVFQQSWQLSSSQECQREDYAAFLENVLKVYLSGMYIFGAAVICAIPFLAKITLKKEFFGARAYIPPMMLAVLIQCISTYFGAILIAFKKTKEAMYGMIIGGGVNVLLSLALIRRMEIWGVLIAGVLCYLSILIHRIWIVGKFIKFNKHFETNVPLFFILCVQTIFMCMGKGLFMLLSVILWVLMVIIILCSYHGDMVHMVKKIREAVGK